MSKKAKKTRSGKEKFSWKLMWKQRYLLLMSMPFLIWLIIFKYIPLWGWTMAFQEVKPKTFALRYGSVNLSDSIILSKHSQTESLDRP